MKEITLHLPFKTNAATYFMGLGQKGGIRPDSVGWKWDVVNKNQDGAWVGAVNAGLQYSLREICATFIISKTTLYRYLLAEAKTHKL